MRTVLIIGLIFLCGSLCGCQKSADQKLIGKWQGKIVIDDAKLQAKLDELKSNPIKLALTKAFLEGIKKGTMDAELKADGSYTLTTTLGKLKKDDYGKWTVTHDSGDKAVLQMTSHEGRTQQMAIAFTNDDSWTTIVTGEASEFAEFRCNRVQ